MKHILIILGLALSAYVWGQEESEESTVIQINSGQYTQDVAAGYVIKLGVGANLPAWASLSYFATEEVSLISDESLTIYGDALINVPLVNNLTVDYTCDIGTESGNNIAFSPTSGDIGNHNLICKFYNNGILFKTSAITLSVYAKPPVKSKKILLIGDSTMGADSLGHRIVTILPNVTFTFLGTVNSSGYLNEGYSGATWHTLLIGTKGKFYKTDRLNLPAFFTDNSLAVPDYVYARLGINDVFTSSTIGGDGLTDAEIGTIINDAKVIVDSFLVYNANLKIILGVPTICENTGAGWNANYDESVYSQNSYIQNIHKYWVAFVDTFSDYNSRVTCSYEAINLDRNDGYPKTAGVHTNGVHPDASGYAQLGDGFAAALNKDVHYNTYADSLFMRMATPPPDSLKRLISQVFDTLQYYKIWDSLNVIQVYAMHNTTDALLNWKSTSYNATKISTPTFTLYEGFTGNASSWAINTNYNPYANATGNRNNQSFGGYIRVNGTVNKYPFGARESGGNRADLNTQTSTGNLYNTINFNGITAYDPSGAGPLVGFHAKVLTNGTGTQKLNSYIKNQRILNQTVTVTTDTPNLPFYVLSNDYNNGVNTPSNSEVSMFFAGKSFSDTQAWHFNNVFEWYMDQLGKGVE